MRWLVVLIFMSPLALAEAPRLSVGGGFEAKVDHEINSDYNQVDSMGLLFASLAMHPWSALWEVDNYQTNSGEGNYNVRTSTFSTIAWGRYEPWAYWPVSPYVGLGVGWTFQNVSSTFGTANDDRWTDGGAMLGGTLGAMADFWQHWKIEAEMRLVKLEFDDQPVPSFVLRTGYTF